MNDAGEKVDAKSFYDRFDRKLVNDYVGGNPRMLAALEFMKDEVENCGASRILDIGCGLGWSSHTLASMKSVKSVLAVDLSSELIKAARTLFGHSKIEFQQMDVTDCDRPLSGKFDAIVMLDVYEHIPVAARPAFHHALASLLSDTGFLLLSCPTKDHQRYLREHHPEGLQPVDEDVDIPDLESLAEALQGRIDTYRLLNVWNPRDYLHAVIRRSKGSPAPVVPRRTRLAGLAARARARLAR
jgi:SAM-dependent methyltransferase